MSTQTINHPALGRVKGAFPDRHLRASEFRGCTTLIVAVEDAHAVLRFLREDPGCDFDLCSDVTCADYLEYPAEQPGRFGVTWVLRSTARTDLLLVRTWVDPELDTSGTVEDPGLIVDSVTDIWPGAEWREREVYDMYGVRFRNHPDLRRILLWKDYPAHPLRKDYPLRGRGERENYVELDRDAT